MKIEWVDLGFESSCHCIRNYLLHDMRSSISLRIFLESFFAFTIEEAKVVRPEPKAPASTTLNSLADMLICLLDQTRELFDIAIRK